MILSVISCSPVIDEELDEDGQERLVSFEDFKPEHEQKSWVFTASGLDGEAEWLNKLKSKIRHRVNYYDFMALHSMWRIF